MGASRGRVPAHRGAGSRSARSRPPDHSSDGASPTAPWWTLGAAVLVWIILWYFTPGLHRNGVGALVTDESASILLESAAALVILAVVALLHPRRTRMLLASNRQLVLYAIPVLLALALPFHYEMPLPLAVYMPWMAVSVLWQDYLTFGLLQSYLRERFSGLAAVVLVAVVFYAGHAILIPHRFAPPHWLPALGILAMGVVFATIRARSGTLHVLLALHLGFYYLFA